MKEDKGVYLHSNKRVIKGLSLSDYNKGRREKRTKVKDDAKSKGFVVKDNWELVTGWSSSEGWALNAMKEKYLDKFEYYRGTHETRDRR